MSFSQSYISQKNYQRVKTTSYAFLQNESKPTVTRKRFLLLSNRKYFPLTKLKKCQQDTQINWLNFQRNDPDKAQTIEICSPMTVRWGLTEDCRRHLKNGRNRFSSIHTVNKVNILWFWQEVQINIVEPYRNKTWVVSLNLLEQKWVKDSSLNSRNEFTITPIQRKFLCQWVFFSET